MYKIAYSSWKSVQFGWGRGKLCIFLYLSTSFAQNFDNLLNFGFIVSNFQMSAPSIINRDDLREQEYFNYSAIDEYWQERGYTEDYLRIQYKLFTFSKYRQEKGPVTI